MAVETQGTDLIQLVALLGAGVVAVPIFKRLGLGSVLGYLSAGVVIGPFGLRLFTDPQSILHVAELGVVMFLFVIGLEMRPSRLWSLRSEIFGLGLAQVLTCGGLLTVLGIAAGFAPAASFVAGMGFVLSSTAIVMQILDERGETSTPGGQRIVSILLLEDLAIVPLLAIVTFLAPAHEDAGETSRWLSIAIAAGAIAGLLVVGRWLLNPMFRLLATAHAREVMTAAALLVVLGAALVMQLGGLSMAMGAFLAGVLLSESSFRHQLEADIEPFRGILLGLFFLSVGMSLDLGVIARDWPTIVMAVIGYMALKSLGIYVVARLFKADHSEALTRAAMLAQGGEFAFVLYAAATASGIFTANVNAMMTATVIISMALTPLAVIALKWVLPKKEQSLDGLDIADGLEARVLMIGFGRFGQISAQFLLSEGIDVTAIDDDVEMVRSASRFGFKVYYGDGTRLDVLRAAGIERADIVAVCTDSRENTDRIVELVRSEFPLTKLYVRSFDRQHTLKLRAQGVDFEIRETFESAFAFGVQSLLGLGLSEEHVAEVASDIRSRETERLAIQQSGGSVTYTNVHGKLQPQPLTVPKRAPKALNEEAEKATADAAE
ncbi:monovalent cation:proton antiporter-2 (CPA2) family protein [Kaistia dalseonensis]|uniref:Glutathione-regulated potassium-efflux system protein KefB n=1 Tax=Kaistia dalseonensis TaxID=410840 RepID=A0ABU0HCF2_9HYPH|nr:monovalent cation:proton antiporter-2 (CPA2) family protein [Kaistia dalseonensis]MCX5497360.1 monovalent cation:proton antiporter-2 (CPA2) family protein [Kaistia dalseonensis]MDQ0439998.1 glutathione-regulated potassium-efflux system protein KefB [Kaistia dalseonensis]